MFISPPVKQPAKHGTHEAPETSDDDGEPSRDEHDSTTPNSMGDASPIDDMDSVASERYPARNRCPPNYFNLETEVRT